MNGRGVAKIADDVVDFGPAEAFRPAEVGLHGKLPNERADVVSAQSQVTGEVPAGETARARD